ncbi:MAG: hypothetical protein WDZ41_00680 [Candidatus Babeliales bacterium]
MVSIKNKFIFLIIFILFSTKSLFAERSSWASILKESIEQSTVCKDNRFEYQKKIEKLRQFKKWCQKKIEAIYNHGFEKKIDKKNG